jgi:hypothetical protein
MIVFLRFTAACTVLLTADAPTVVFPPDETFLLVIEEDTARECCFGVGVAESCPNSSLVSGGGDWCGVEAFLLVLVISGGENDGKDVKKVGDGLVLAGLRFSWEERDRSEDLRLGSRFPSLRRSILDYEATVF